ncbi:MAG: porin, partial [Mesorhizobium sp.]
DVYGSGYFYIPGTETCLRIGGFVRYDIGVGDREGVQNVPDHLDPTDRNDTYYKNARFTLKTWTNQETELGTLKTFTETRFNFGNGSGDYDDQAAPFPAGYDPAGWQAHNKTPSLNFAWIQLGG